METKVYLTSTDSLNDKALFEALYNLMPKSRQEKIDGYKFDKDKKLSLAAGALLRFALMDNGIFAETNDMEITLGEYGKPQLLNHADVQFNLSHSGNMAMCIISSDDVGCDIEEIQDDKHKIAERFFNSEEVASINAKETESEKDLAFFRVWTLREAYYKMEGTGIGLPFDIDGFDVSGVKAHFLCREYDDKYAIFEFDEVPGYATSICVKNPSACKPELSLIELANIGY